MEPTIYIDVLFFVTWGMDAFLLWAAGRIAGFRGKNWRIFLGGLLSAVGVLITRSGKMLGGNCYSLDGTGIDSEEYLSSFLKSFEL